MKKCFLMIGVILTTVLVFSFGALAVEPAPPFTDLDQDAWYVEIVTELADQGIIHGYSDSTFRADNTITRAEFATMVYNTFIQAQTSEVDASDPGASFTDVNENDWYYTAVMALAQEGVVHGYGDKSFRPDANITREEIAYILFRIVSPIGILNNDAPEDAYVFFPDVLAGRWSASAINFLVLIDVVNGYPDGTFGPANPATRAEASVMLYHLFSLSTIS